jgi:hypothetical protein
MTQMGAKQTFYEGLRWPEGERLVYRAKMPFRTFASEVIVPQKKIHLPVRLLPYCAKADTGRRLS